LKIKAIYFHICLISFCLLIFIQSSIPGDELPKVEFQLNDKFIHAAIYFVLYILFFYSLKYQTKSIKLQRFSFEFALLFTVLYGISDEFHQYFVPNRSSEFNDVLADIAGALIGMAAVKYFLVNRITASVILISFVISGCSSSKKVSENYMSSNKVYITEADAWIDKMPGIGRSDIKFGFLVSVNIESDKVPEDFSIKNFTIYFNNDTVKTDKVLTETFKITDDAVKLNVIHDLTKIYPDSKKSEPVTSQFRFDVYYKSKKISSVKTENLKILTVQ